MALHHDYPSGAKRWAAILGITGASYHVFLLFVFSMEPWTWVATYSDYKGNKLIGGFLRLEATGAF